MKEHGLADGQTQAAIVEREGDLERMVCQHAPSAHRRLPGEVVHVHAGRLLRLALGERHRAHEHAAVAHYGVVQIGGRIVGVHLAVHVDERAGPSETRGGRILDLQSERLAETPLEVPMRAETARVTIRAWDDDPDWAARTGARHLAAPGCRPRAGPAS